MQRPWYTAFRENTQISNQHFHFPRLIISRPPHPNPTTQLIYTSQTPPLDYPLTSWLEMGLQGYALIFTIELNNQEIILLVQNPTHLAEIVIEGMRLGMEAVSQNQWSNTQTPLVLDHNRPSSLATSPWAHPPTPPLHGLNQIMGLLLFYPQHHTGMIYAPWFEHMNSFSPPQPILSPTSIQDPLSPLLSPPITPPPSPNELGEQTRLELAQIMEEMRETRTEFIWLKGFYLYSLKEQYAKKFILKCPPELTTCSVNIRANTNPEEGKYAMVIIRSPRQTTPMIPQTQAPLGVMSDIADLDEATNHNLS
ncbi:hypothetical protein A4A49_54773 [Nicotiana attenuata]|uniref:Uncharacterized protein n=1 Tax=Nicotiana attenuata TaxID=49451 RepID=A0A314KNX4_NICAT|nr:hypothetical protein A4A49_54773 [Nicotiana attenuata]